MSEVFEKWAQRLLDTSKRNPLIHFKESKYGKLYLIVGDTKEFFDDLMSGRKAKFVDINQFLNKNDSDVSGSLTFEPSYFVDEETTDFQDREIYNNEQIIAFDNEIIDDTIISLGTSISNNSITILNENTPNNSIPSIDENTSNKSITTLDENSSESQKTIYFEGEYLTTDEYLNAVGKSDTNSDKYFDKTTNSTKNTNSNFSSQKIKYESTQTSPEDISSILKSKEYKNRIVGFQPVTRGKPMLVSDILKKMKKSVKDILTEKGSNVLYVAFGNLSLTIQKSSKYETMIMPLVLFPVKLDSTNDTYYLSRLDDEPDLNPVLEIYLKYELDYDISDFKKANNLLDIGVEQYLNNFENFVSKRSECSVNTHIALGIFGFDKVSMYNDMLDNKEKILSHTIAGNIIDFNNPHTLQSYSNGSAGTIGFDEYFSKGREVRELHNVVDADSSQIETIALIKAGHNLVIQGPPGTGKSQTITNIIAELLHDGKSVLFVSEKIAALNVVYDRLSKAGLQQFCLELHSAEKIDKKSIAQNLAKSLDISIYKDINIETQKQELINHKNTLDKYVKALHTKFTTLGITPYQIFSKIFGQHLATAKDIEYIIPGIEYFDKTTLDKSLEVFRGYSETKPEWCTDFRKSIWYGCTVQNANDYVFKNTFKNQLDAAYEYFTNLSEFKNSIFSTYNFDKDTTDRQFYDFIKVLNTLSSMSYIESEFLNMFKSTLLDLNIEKIRDDMIQNGKGWISRTFNSTYKNVIKTISSHFCSASKHKHDDIVAALNNAVDYKNFKGICDLVLSRTQNDNGRISTLNKTDYDNIISQIKSQCQKYAEINKSKQSVDDIQAYFDKTILDFDSLSISQQLERILNFQNNIESLVEWTRFYQHVNALKNFKLYDWMCHSIDIGVSSNDLSKVFEKSFYTQLLSVVFYQNSTLSSFERHNHDQVVELFSKSDKELFKAHQTEVYNKCAKNIRKSIDSAQMERYNPLKSQIAYLRKESGKQRAHKPTRQLMQDNVQLIQILKPCFLMSPKSVSTYLKDVEFDVLVFDEASQIFPWDSIGSVYRSKQVVVVGDSKQMPPSNFFVSVLGGNDEEVLEDDDDPAGFESILDKCITLKDIGFSEKTLKWHYRSRVEQLISFSNKYFYDNKLITFPSIRQGPHTGVEFYLVENGLYSKNKNETEAQRVVELIAQHIHENPDRSVGVIAFSSTQQACIEIAIDSRLAVDRYFKATFDDFESKHTDEPFFIKNLENVQGDERDTIIFSVGYGYDEARKFRQHFGPLSTKGGERRLNVAVTRAKYNCKLVSSIRAYDINTNSAKSEGAKLLKYYLDYAENKNLNLDNITINDTNNEHDTSFDSDFEYDVYEYLKSLGYTVHTQVGVSGFRIDLAIRHHIYDIFVLAIECDGATYHSGRNARDRDRLRQSILESQGWNFYRIWSTDWFKNNSVEKAKLKDYVAKAIADFDEKHRDIKGTLLIAEAKHVETSNTNEENDNKVPLESGTNIKLLD